MAKRGAQPKLLDAWARGELSKKPREGDCETQDEESETEELSSVVSDSEVTSDYTPGGSTECIALCCVNSVQPFQPKHKQILLTLSYKKRNFQSQWYASFPWLTVCISQKKVFCQYCWYATQNGLITFSKMGEKAFTESGFQNWRKAVDKFKSHESSHVHREAQMKCATCGQPTIESRL